LLLDSILIVKGKYHRLDGSRKQRQKKKFSYRPTLKEKKENKLRSPKIPRKI
jgi:hypothetical protein